MLIGAALMVGLQVIGVKAAFMSVNLDVIAFLFGMFSIVSALDRAGVLQRVAARMLAAASTIAGNLTILGAASNVIIIEGAEARGVRAFSFLEFFKVGGLVTATNLAVHYLFIVLI